MPAPRADCTPRACPSPPPRLPPSLSLSLSLSEQAMARSARLLPTLLLGALLDLGDYRWVDFVNAGVLVAGLMVTPPPPPPARPAPP